MGKLNSNTAQQGARPAPGRTVRKVAKPAGGRGPLTMEEYLAGVAPGQRDVLEKLRRIIKAAAPGAEECISYGLAAFRFNGRPLVAFGARRNHCALYPMSAATVESFHDQLRGFETSRGTIRFSDQTPLPTALVRKIVKARIAESHE